MANEQLHRLTTSFSRDSITRQEYEELLPFMASPTFQSPSQEDATEQPHAAVPMSSTQHSRRSVHFVDHVSPPDPMESPLQYQLLAPIATPSSGLQLRCPACGLSNDTARGPHCDVCNSRLLLVQVVRRTPTTRERVEPPTCSFSMSEDGQLVIQDGFFSCLIQDTATLPPVAKGRGCQVFVMCCTWQPRQAREDTPQQTQATWYVSQRLSHFEKLHKVLKRRLARFTLPPFPAKYHLTDRLEKRRQGLRIYMPRLLEMCANAPDAQPLPELDEFLDIVHQIQLFRSSGAAAMTTFSQPVTRSFSTMADLTRLPVQLMVPPMDETELAQAEGAVRLFAEAVRHARGDVRGNGTIQHHLAMCVHLAPRVQRSADVDNPFANADLIPRAMQCEEDLQRVVAMYNDALLAVSSVASIQHQGQNFEPNVQAPASAA